MKALVVCTVTVLDWTLEYQDYKDQLVDQAALMLTLSGRVNQTQQVLATQFSFRLRTPDLSIKVNRRCRRRRQRPEHADSGLSFSLPASFTQPLGEAVVGERMAVEISFTNPLPRPLEAVIFHLEGLGLVTARRIKYG